MSSSQPYLLRALNEWIVDNGFTPQVLVDSTHPDLNIPDAVRTENKVVLNISPGAVRDLEIDNEYLSFVARFSGVSHAVVAPIEAVLAIYARENGQGMMFPESEGDDDGSGDNAEGRNRDDDRDDNRDKNGQGPDGDGPKRGKPNLKVIK